MGTFDGAQAEQREVRVYEPSRELDDPMHVDAMIELAERRVIEQSVRRWGADA